MNRILEIDWFAPKKRYSERELEPYVGSIEDAFGIKKYPLGIVDDVEVAVGALWSDPWITPYSAALGAAHWAAQSAGRAASRGAAYYAAWDAALGAARDAVYYAARDVGWGAAWDASKGAAYIIAQDLPDLHEKYPVNPFGELIKVYAIGLWPAGIGIYDKNKKFIIWHPAVGKEKG
jgi:hypothetical protein